MSFEQRKQAALDELGQTGIWHSNYKPPAVVILWKLGFKVKPPHYNRFLSNAFWLGLWFAIGWGTIMWFVQWRFSGLPVFGALLAALGAGAFFGIMMGWYYRWSAQKHRLSNWNDLPVRGDS